MNRLTVLYFLYNVVLFGSFPLVCGVIALRWTSRLRNYSWNLGSRVGYWKDDFEGARWVWVHVASFGELKAVVPLLKQLPKELSCHVVLTLMTPEALSWAREHRLAERIYSAPLDFPFVLRRLYARVKPVATLFVESDFWPNWVREASRSGSAVYLVNGRMSVRSSNRFKRFASWLRPFWEQFAFMAVRESQDEEHFIEAGARPERLHILGQLKYDTYRPRREPRPADGFFKICVGSSREGEEALLLPILHRLQARYSHVRWIIAPRHLGRLCEIESLCHEMGLRYACKVKMDLRSTEAWSQVDGVLWNTFGDLVAGYAEADCVIIGGSFVSKGGQNPIEPAALGRPVVMGPSMENFKAVAEHLTAANGAIQCSLANLEEQLERLITDPSRCEAMGDRAVSVVLEEQGATARTINFLKTCLQTPPTS